MQRVDVHFRDGGGGALSLPIRKPITEGWLRSRRASLAIEASATFIVGGIPRRAAGLGPRLPFVAALPAGEYHDAVAVGEVVETLILQLAFAADGVEAEVEDVAELGLHALGVVAQEHVRRPAAAANQHGLAVDDELAITLLGEVGTDAAYAERRAGPVGDAPSTAAVISSCTADVRPCRPATRSSDDPVEARIVLGENETVCVCPGARWIVRLQRNAGHDAGDRRVVRRPHRGFAPPPSRSARRARDRERQRRKSPADSSTRPGPVRTMSTPRHGPMLLSGGVGFQSTQPIDRLVLGSAGCTRNGESVGARVYPARHVELMHGIGAGDGGVVGDQMPIDPHIGARDHAVDTQQRMCPATPSTSVNRCDTTRESRTGCRWNRAPAPHAGCRCRTRFLYVPFSNSPAITVARPLTGYQPRWKSRRGDFGAALLRLGAV
jgi:hypothetical protein